MALLMSSYSTRTATLGGQKTPRDGGKKIDTWKFNRPHPDRDSKHRPEADVDVYLLSDPTTGFGFRLQSVALPPGDWHDTDLERLRVAARTTLEEQDELLGGIKWAPWLEVQTSLKIEHMPDRHHQAQTGRHLEITYRPLLRGVHPADSKRVLTINSNGCAVPFPNPLTPESIKEDRELKVRPGKKPGDPGSAEDLIFALGRDDHRTTGDTYAYLPDTPENRAALDQIFKGMETLGDRLHALLSPTEVAASMLNIGQSLPGLPLLGSPAAEPPPRRTVRPG